MSWVLVASLLGAVDLKVHAQPEAPRTPAPDPSIDDALGRLADRYRRQPQSQSCRIRVIDAAGRERASRIGVLTVPAGEGRPARVALQFGRALHVEVIDRSLRAISPGNALLVFETTLDAAVSPGAFMSLLPPIPIPHVDLAFGGPFKGEGEHLGTWNVKPFGSVRFETLERDAQAGETVFRGSSPGGSVLISVDNLTGLLRRLEGNVGSPNTPLRIEIVCRPADPSTAWTIDPAGRQAVRSLTELRPSPAETGIGMAVAGLGLMTPDLNPWSVPDAIADQAAQPADAGQGPMLAAIVLYRHSSPEAEDAALHAVGIIRGLKKNLDRRRLGGDARTPRMLLRAAAVFEPAEFQPAAARELADVWAVASELAVWTSAGQRVIDRFAQGANAVAILLNQDMTLLAAVEIDGRAIDADAVLAEFKGALDEVGAE